MQIQLMRYTGEPYRLDKTGRITSRFAMDGNLRDRSSVIDPVIRIEKTTPPPQSYYNYMYIPEFERYYFINDITTVVNQIWEIRAHVDVLFTYCSTIKNTKCIISKTENVNDANLYLNDGSFVMDSRKYNQVIQFPSGLSDSGHNILICAGGD